MATELENVSPPKSKVLVAVETVTDIERSVSDQKRRIQRYMWKIRNNKGTKETALKNIGDAIRIIDELMKEGKVAANIQQDIESLRTIYQQLKTKYEIL